jgi:pSer/pThr/pTyr-binding forkhead associated (FHA) protein
VFNLVLLVLKFTFLVLLYLFLLLVVRVVYRDISLISVKRHGQKRTKGTARLILIEGPQEPAGKVFVLSSETTLGRSPENQIVLTDDSVSQRHARLLKREEEYFLEDLDSTNGTFLEGERIKEPIRLNSGDRVKVGRTIFQFRT